jgi:hypothetical protein
MSSYRLDKMLLAIYTCKYCRVCVMQFKGSGMTGGSDWFLHRGNTPSHTLLVVQRFLAENNIPVIIQPPYSPNLTPSDF